jgi:hypothetical protein
MRMRTSRAAVRTRDMSKSVTKNNMPHKRCRGLSRMMLGIIKLFKEATPESACTTEKEVLLIED